MSTIELSVNESYRSLITSYLESFYYPIFERLFDATPTGAAHSASGTDFYTLVKTISTSICICGIQIACFCIFRPIFKNIYQPRCYYVSTAEKMEPLPNGLLSWILPTLRIQSNFYLSMGLDAYFFVRFINMLLIFFSIVGTLNMVILLPIDWFGSDTTYRAQGLDRLSVSNISSSKRNQLNAHLVMCLVTVILFHFFLVYELRTFIKIKIKHSNSPFNNSIISKTVLITNVPDEFLEYDSLSKLLNIIPGGVNSIWFTYESSKIQHYVKQAKDTLDTIEKSQLAYMKKYIRKTAENYPTKYHVYDPSLESKFYPPIYCAPIFIPIIKRTLFLKFPGVLRLFLNQTRTSIVEWSIKRLNTLHKLIQDEKISLANGQQTKHNKVFVCFNSRIGSNITSQCLLSQWQSHFDRTLQGVNPDDIVWENLTRKSTTQILFQRFCVTIIFISIIALYIIPVSIIGVVFQIDFLAQVMPFFKWMYNFPEGVRELLSCFLPSLFLTILMDIMITVFRFLSQFRGYFTGAQLEESVQEWYFTFLFFQQFLVVTISSSIVDIFTQVVDQPASIPVLLALNLPKSATFFFQYISLKAFAFCGSNFLKINRLMKEVTIYNLFESTPRQTFQRLITLPAIHFGTLYPIYSVYACIGIIYTIISPLISVFILFILFLVLLYYKYALKYVFTHINKSETHGKLYPTALFQLYTGIYCLESCLIGIFFMSKSDLDNDVNTLQIEAWIMCLVLVLTIFCHIAIYNRYSKYFRYQPILGDYSDTNLGEQKEDIFYSFQKQLYHHPDFKYEYPKLWLPEDSLGIGKDKIKMIEDQLQFMEGGTTKGAILVKGNFQYRCLISQQPPDFK